MDSPHWTFWESQRHPRGAEVGWAGLGRASLGQPARCRLSRRSRGPWVKPLTVSRRLPALSELRRLLCTCTEMAAVEQCRAGLGSAVQAWPGGREDGPEGACPTGKPPLPRERAARSRGRDLAGVQLVTVRVFHGRSHRWVVGGRRGLCRCGCLAGPRCSLRGPWEGQRLGRGCGACVRVWP